MFRIALSPKFSEAMLRLEKSGNMLKLNGTPCHFETLNDDDDEIPSDAINCDWILGAIKKIDGIINLTIIMPYSNSEAPEYVRFPEPIMLIEDTEIIFNEKVDE